MDGGWGEVACFRRRHCRGYSFPLSIYDNDLLILDKTKTKASKGLQRPPNKTKASKGLQRPPKAIFFSVCFFALDQGSSRGVAPPPRVREGGRERKRERNRERRREGARTLAVVYYRTILRAI